MADCPVLPSLKIGCSGSGCYGAEELRWAVAIAEAIVANPPGFALAPGTAVEITDGVDTLAVNSDGSINVIAQEAAGALTALPPQLVASGSTTTAYSVDGSKEWTIQVDVVNTSGTQDIDLEASIDGVSYYTLASLSVTASDTFGFSTVRPHQFVRVNWSSGGTGTVDAQIWEIP